MERLGETARETLGSGDANTHAREAAGAATNQNAAEVGHGVTAVLERREGR